MLYGTDIVREVEASGARPKPAGARNEPKFGLDNEEGESWEDGWVDWDRKNWVEDTGVDLEGAEVGTEADAEPEAEAAANDV